LYACEDVRDIFPSEVCSGVGDLYLYEHQKKRLIGEDSEGEFRGRYKKKKKKRKGQQQLT